MVKERQDITGSNCLKGVSGKVVVDEKGIKDSWKEYTEKLTNKEDQWDHEIIISAEVKEGPADCIRIDEVVAALKKMKMHKAPGLSGLSAEMIQATEGIGTQWLLDLCSGNCKRRLYSRGLEVKCDITHLQRERSSNGVWILWGI